MKTLTLALLALCLALPLRADNALQNGDFTDGITHWHGDGRSPADFASDNPMAKPDPITSKGMIIPLRHLAWTKVAQDFKSKTGDGTLTITYLVSPDLTFSTKDEDYDNMPGHLGWGWKTFKIPTGSWMVSLNDSTGTTGFHYSIKNSGAPGTPQTQKLPLKATPNDKNTLTICIPPGTGNFVLLSVSIEDK
jgi:hypothetical protein